MTWHTVLTSLITSAIATWALILALVASPHFLDRLLGHYLETRSAAERARRDREMESLKVVLGHLQDRGRRSNEREYQAIVAAWEAVNEAFYEVTTTIFVWSSKPDLEDMSAEELRERLEESQFSPREIRYVSNAKDRGEAYQHVERTRRIMSCCRFRGHAP